MRVLLATVAIFFLCVAPSFGNCSAYVGGPYRNSSGVGVGMALTCQGDYVRNVVYRVRRYYGGWIGWQTVAQFQLAMNQAWPPWGMTWPPGQVWMYPIGPSPYGLHQGDLLWDNISNGTYNNRAVGAQGYS